MTTPDLQFRNLGFAVQCEPITDAGADWLAENVTDESTWLAGALLIEFPYLQDIVIGARADGLVCRG